MLEVRAITVQSQVDIDVSGFVVTATGLVINGDPSLDEWTHFGRQAGLVGRAVHWAIGDWLNYGETRWGETYTQAMEETGFEYQTLRNDKWLAERIELSRRRDNLSWSHHAEVGALDPDEQDYWLELAEKKGWSRNELRKAIKGDEDTPHVAQSTGNNEWYTPPEYIEAARSVMGEIDLDPASSELANKVVQATEFYTIEDDGLLYDWHGRVWMNPPYASHLIGLFTGKLAEHVQQGDVSEACILVNNATETEWFRVLVAQASCVCFPAGRVRFLSSTGEKGSPLQGQAVLYCGPGASTFGRVFSKFGVILYARRDQE